MKTFFLTAALAAGVLGASALPSMADQVKVVNTDTATGQLTVSGSNVMDMFTFTASGSEFSGSLTENVPNFQLTGASLTGGPYTTFAPFVFAPPPPSVDSFLTFDATGLVQGDKYTLTVLTSGTGLFGGTITGGTPSTVPLPGSVAMFGAALAGLGVVGFARKKGKALPAAA